MAAKFIEGPAQRREISNGLGNWIMVALTLMLVLLYGAAMLGWVKPLADDKMVSRLEPIIFVVIGYYFGRLPSQQNENALKGEISRQTQRADAAQHAKEQAQQTREALEEKVKNVRTTLVSTAPGAGAKGSVDILNNSGDLLKEDNVRQSLAAAIRILNS